MECSFQVKFEIPIAYAQPGKKLLFMGGEFGQWREWNHDESLDWHLLEFSSHRGLKQWVGHLTRFYRHQPALYECDYDPAGFESIDCHDAERSVISLIRRGHAEDDIVLAVFNFTPVPHYNYPVGVPRRGFWRKILNSDSWAYGGSGTGKLRGLDAAPIPHHGHPHSLSFNLPPLAAVFFKWEEG